MIESFFGFTGTPFSKGVPLDALYNSPALSEVMARLQMTAERQLFTVLTAEVGSGKTTAIRKFDSILDKSQFILFYMSDSQLTPPGFTRGCWNSLALKQNITGMKPGFSSTKNFSLFVRCRINVLSLLLMRLIFLTVK